MKKISLKTRGSLTGLAFVAPWIIGFLLLTAYPLICTLFFSFNNVKVTPSEGILTEFIGWQNYIRAFTSDPAFLDEMTGYISEIIIYVPVIIVVSLIIALLINSKFKGTGIFRTIFFLPVIITSGPVIKQFMEQGTASVADIAGFFDLSLLYDAVPELLADSVSFLINSFIIILWFSGVQILIYLAALKKIDKSVYEAAKIDGAGKWEVFWKLTLPSLNAIIILNVVYTVVTQSLFSLNPIVQRISGEMTNAETGYGYAAALAWIYTGLIIVTLAVFVLLFFRREKKYKAAYNSKY